MAPASSAHDDQESARRDAARELLEGPVDLRKVGVVIEVVGLDVRDDRGERRQQQERLVALVGLGHEQVAAAVVRVGTRLVEIGADRERGILAAVLEGAGEHRGGGRLPVRTGHRNPSASGHDGGKRGCTRQDPQPAPTRLDQLGVGVLDGGGHHYGVGRAQVGRVMTERDPRTENAQRGQHPGLLGVAAGDLRPAREHDAGNARHATAAYADEVHDARVRRQAPRQQAPHQGVRRCSSGYRIEDHVDHFVVGVAPTQVRGRH